VGRQVPIILHNYNDKIAYPGQRTECDLVESVARLIRDGNLEAATSSEVLFEFMKLPKTFPTSGGILFGADYRIVRAPVMLGYRLTAPAESFRRTLESISNPRYLEIRRQVGAFQGQKQVPLNQLFDALFLWTAEASGCNYFLTVERKLFEYPFRSHSLKCVRPSTLLAEFGTDHKN